MPTFGRKSEILSPKSSAGCPAKGFPRELTVETDRMKAKRHIPAHFKGCDLKKQFIPRGSQSVGLRPENRNTKPEIRNELNGCNLKKQSQF